MATYYDENKKTWYCKFSYKDWMGKTRYTTKTGFKLKKEAQAYEKDFKNKSKETPNLSLDALSQAYLKDYKINRRPNSYKLTENNIRLHILPYLGEMPVEEISPLVIKNWKNEILEKGKSESTVHAINTTFKGMLNYAVRYYNLEDNPFEVTGIDGTVGVRENFIEIDEWERLDSFITDKFDKAVFNLLFYSGLRIGELLALTLDDIDFKKGIVNVDKKFNDTTYKVEAPKTKASIRKVTIPSHVVKLIKEYVDALVAPEKYIFKRMSRNALSDRLKKYCKLAGVQDASPHILRHSHASYLIKLGTIPINAIAKRLGHSPAMTLKIYAHVYKNQDAEIASILEKPEKKVLKLA